MKTTLEAQDWRYATKQFDPTKKLTDAQVDLLKETLRLTPSSFGVQPWKFVMVETPELRQKLVEQSWGQAQVADASHLFVLCRLTEITEEWVLAYMANAAETRGVPLEAMDSFRDVVLNFIKGLDDEQKADWMNRQSYIALGNLMTVCAYEGIDACPMEGFNPAGYSEVLNLPELGLTPVVACPVGFRSKEDKYAAIPKVRFPAETVHLTL
ncbi:MAG: NAD(P)H-dependent oxidoreductase [Opitutales bacterium]|nr:NAD(P)H-dependent oxidoreductase [Opitutales bacterium]NRA28509.1 NAD(P)H-dependent oxidoreductase [Opitutales bacterium]